MNIFTKAITTLAHNLGLTDRNLFTFIDGSGVTQAGESVTVDSAMQLDVVWSCVRLITETIATLPVFLYKRGEDGLGAIDDRHAYYKMLHSSPNADMTATVFWTVVVSSMLLWGNSYILKERFTQGGRVISLYPMRPDRITIRRNKNNDLEYVYTWRGEVVIIEQDDVIHIRGFSLDGFYGMSPIGTLREVISASSAAQKISGSFFKNGMQPSLAMNAPAYLNDSQRTRAKVILQEYSGAAAAGRIPLLEGGWKLENLMMKPEDAQLLETRHFQVEQLCRIFSVPPAMIGHYDKTSAFGTAREQMMIWFLTFCVRPHIKRIEQSLQKHLLSASEQSTHYAEFNVMGLLRADSEARAKLYSSAAQNGWMTRDEIRALENLPKLPGGDKLTVQSALLPIELLGKVKTNGANIEPEPTNEKDPNDA